MNTLFGIIGLIIGAISLALGVISVLGIKIPFIRRRSWRNIKRCVNALSYAIQRDGFCPDVVIGVEGGGNFVGSLLVTNWLACLRSKEIPFFVWGRYFEGQEPRHPIYTNNIPDDYIKGKKVLLVDGTVYTGVTMGDVKALLEKKQPLVIKTAALFKQKGTAFEDLNFFVYEVTRRELMPWAYTQEYKDRYGRW